MSKRIAKIEVVHPGSSPDVDSDFNTSARNVAIEHVKDVYGVDNVAAIGTFTTLAARGAFKAMCTIYSIPFAQANKIVSLIPGPIEGVDCTIDDLYDPSSQRYDEGVDFRNATAGPEWTEIVSGARAIAGRNKAVGVHPCGIVISSTNLAEVAPLRVRQDDGLVVTQWSYPELESLGLIKMDFLGLDTVDLHQATVELIMQGGKTPPNLLEIMHGPCDDKKVYEMLGRGETLGLFQLASAGVQDLLKRMKPTSLMDIVATTALFRPGPMGMLSHVKYADRKNGRESYEYPVHPDFKGSPLEEILKDTYGLCVYQEQIIKIASEIGGMTLQEGDDLRSAMGKKKVAQMAAARPKFMQGGMANGYSEEAMDELWETIAEFARYGFNKAHSVAYAINAYLSAYLKAHYPTEFMSALITQKIDDKPKTLSFLQEARRMGLKVGSVDINASYLKVSPDFKGVSDYDILYGISSVSSVSLDVAKTIISERERNGAYKSVQDLITRCMPLGVSNRRIYENLAKAGAFDSFNVSRRGVIENLRGMMDDAKTKKAKGMDLFDMFASAGNETAALSVDLNSVPEYGHIEKLKGEAEVIGLYLTSHPLAHVGPGLAKMRSSTVASLYSSPGPQTATIVGSLTEIFKKIMRRGGKAVSVTIDDGTGYLSANLSQELVKGIDKKIAQDKIRKLHESGQITEIDELLAIATDPKYTPMEDLEQNSVYMMELTYRPPQGEAPYNARIKSIVPLPLAHDGALPIRMRFKKKNADDTHAEKLRRALPKAVAERNPGSYPIFAATYVEGATLQTADDSVYFDAARELLEKPLPVASAKPKKAAAKGNDLWAENEPKAEKEEKGSFYRVWPPKPSSETAARKKKVAPPRELSEVEFLQTLVYEDTGYTADKTKKLELDIEKYLGAEGYDFGILDPDLFE